MSGPTLNTPRERNSVRKKTPVNNKGESNMSNVPKTTIEKMKEIIEEKKKKSAQQGIPEEKAAWKIGGLRKAFNNTKRGGVTDK